MRRTTRGDYYATASYIENGRRKGWQVARQARTLREARAAVDAFNRPGATGRGYVQLWSDATASRTVVAERDEAGNWWAPEPFTGTLLPLAPLTTTTPKEN